VIFALFWSLMSIFPLMLVMSHVPALEGPLYLLAAVIAFAAPAVLKRDWLEIRQITQRRRGQNPHENILPISLVVLQAMAAVLILTNIHLQEIPLTEVIRSPISVGNSYLALRYTDGLQTNAAAQIAVIFNYAGASLGGVAVATRTRVAPQMALGAVALLPSLMMLVLYADKGTLLLAISYFLAGIIVSHVARGETGLLTKRSAIIAIFAAMALIPIILGALIIKATGGSWNDDSDMLASLHFYLVSYGGAHLFTFSDWLANYLAGTTAYADPESHTWGYWTFLGLGRLLNPDAVVAGYYAEYFKIPGVLMSNIYTMFRGLIYDFGVVGSLLFMAAAGAIASEAYRFMLRDAHSPLAQSIYIFILGAIYSSYLISITTWNSVYVSTVIVFAVLWFAQYLRRKGLSC
jgi:oligosaccharide repeat unit polymerase